jgi:hypothetical protein
LREFRTTSPSFFPRPPTHKNYLLFFFNKNTLKMPTAIETRVFKQVSPAVITLYQQGKENSIASGYIHNVINGNLVVATAAHAVLVGDGALDTPPAQTSVTGLEVLVRGAFLKGVKHAKDVQEPVVVLGVSANDDVALLVTVSGHFDPKRQWHLCVSKRRCQVGDFLAIVGVPLGLVEPQPSYGEVRDCSIFPEIRNPEWTQEAPSIMGTAPVADGSSGSPMLDQDGGVWSIAQWRLSSASTFVGGIHPQFFKAIVERLLEVNAENLKSPTVDLTRVDFDASTRKGLFGIVSEDVLAGSTLQRLRQEYPLFAASELARCPKGFVVLDLVPVYDDNGNQVGALGADARPDDIVVGFGNPPEVVRVGDDSFQWLFLDYFRLVEKISVVIVRPSTMETLAQEWTIGRFPSNRERVGVVENYNLIDATNCPVQFNFVNFVTTKDVTVTSNPTKVTACWNSGQISNSIVSMRMVGRTEVIGLVGYENNTAKLIKGLESPDVDIPAGTQFYQLQRYDIQVKSPNLLINTVYKTEGEGKETPLLFFFVETFNDKPVKGKRYSIRTKDATEALFEVIELGSVDSFSVLKLQQLTGHEVDLGVDANGKPCGSLMTPVK